MNWKKKLYEKINRFQSMDQAIAHCSFHDKTLTMHKIWLTLSTLVRNNSVLMPAGPEPIVSYHIFNVIQFYQAIKFSFKNKHKNKNKTNEAFIPMGVIWDMFHLTWNGNYFNKRIIDDWNIDKCILLHIKMNKCMAG